LPARPGNLTSTLLVATGVDVSVGARFAPRDLVGKVVVAFFAPAADGGAVIIRFEPSSPGAKD
jgi:hypothetical protein